MALKVPLQEAAEIAIGSIRLGFDVAADIRLKYCKRESPDPCLIELDAGGGQAGETVHLPGDISVFGHPKSIKCDKGERTWFRSDVLSFQQGWCLCGYQALSDVWSPEDNKGMEMSAMVPVVPKESQASFYVDDYIAIAKANCNN